MAGYPTKAGYLICLGSATFMQSDPNLFLPFIRLLRVFFVNVKKRIEAAHSDLSSAKPFIIF